MLDLIRQLWHDYLSAEGIQNLVRTYGTTGIATIVFVETGLLVGFFLPGDSLLVTAGILAASHKIPKLTFMGGYGDYTYGAPANRMFTPQTTVFAIKRDAPNGTNAIEVNHVSDAAKQYKPA